MKLRNKKTGEICEFGGIRQYWREKEDGGVGYLFRKNDEDGGTVYNSFAEFCEEWEDYVPKEPLIKDEKIRKAVRAWAEANEIVKAFIVMNERMNWTIHGDDADRNRFRIEFFDRVVSENDETKNYTIAELCGEEEE